MHCRCWWHYHIILNFTSNSCLLCIWLTSHADSQQTFFYHSVQKMILSWIFQQPKIIFRYLSFIFSFYSSYLFSVFYPRCSSGWCDSLKKWSFIQLIQTHLVMKKKKIKSHCLSRELDDATRWRLCASNLIFMTLKISLNESTEGEQWDKLIKKFSSFMSAVREHSFNFYFSFSSVWNQI